MWTDDVDVNIVSFSHFYVLACVVQKSSASSFNLVCVYGDPHHQQTNSIWNVVFSFVVQNQGRPTLCIGDLNNIMHPNEKWGPGPPCLSRIDNFCTLVKQCGLMNLGYGGLAYTWTNKRFTTNPTFERLDRCPGDSEWYQALLLILPSRDWIDVQVIQNGTKLSHPPLFITCQCCIATIPQSWQS